MLQPKPENLSPQVSLFNPASSAQRDLFRKSTTYLAKIAVVLQDAPDKMLTFTQMMEKMAPLICEDRKSVENNIRVCLSTNKCFVKIPVVPDSLNSKRNYWKLDSSEITAKMVRRHFKGILQLFPELASKVEAENLGRPSEDRPAPRSPEPAAGRAVQGRGEVKFSGPFSIESLLERDSPPAPASTASPLASVPLMMEQQPGPPYRAAGLKRSFSCHAEEPLFFETPAGSSSICSAGGSTYHVLSAQPIKRMPVYTEPVYTEPSYTEPVYTEPVYTEPSYTEPVYTEPSYPVYAGVSAARYFSSPHSSYITYSVPAFTHDAVCLWL